LTAGQIASFRFKREEHLKGRKEIREVFGKGKVYGSHSAKLFILKNNLPYNRICFSLSKGFGNAVSRNRARRLGREAFRLMKYRLENGYDFILLVYPESVLSLSGTAAKQTLQDRSKQLESLFKKAGLLK